MPGHHSSVSRWLAEELIVEETHRGAEQLICDHAKPRAVEEVVKRLLDAPPTESMEEHRIWILRLVGMKLVEERIPRMRWIHQARQLLSEDFHLLRLQHRNSRDKSVLLEMTELLARKSVI